MNTFDSWLEIIRAFESATEWHNPDIVEFEDFTNMFEEFASLLLLLN